jgi:glycosyltransferase involved in cell wall biosynthesis
MIAYPVTINRGYFGYEVSKDLLEDIIRFDGDIIHVHSYYLFMYDLIALTQKVNQKPLIAHYHGGYPNELLWMLRRLKRLSLPLANKVIATNRTELQRLIGYWRLPKDRAVYIPNGIDTNFFRPLNNIDVEDNLVLFVGNIVPRKGIESLILAFKKCRQKIRDLRLMIVGEGYMRQELETKVRSLGLATSIEFSGRLTHEQLKIVYNRSAVTVLPSEKESFGLVLGESMACSTPVIATITEGSKDIVSHGVDGLLVPQNDMESLTSAICKLVSNKSLRIRMGEKAREKVVRSFSWKKIGGRLKVLYESLR